MTSQEPLQEASLRGQAQVQDLVTSPSRQRVLSPRSDESLSAMWRGTAPPDITNHFRAIRRELMMSLGERADPGSAATILVTSALPGDGKTFVAASIARTFAHAPDTLVTLLDFDLMRRTLSRVLDANRLRGIDECLSARGDLRRVTYKTDVPRLNFVPAGAASADSREAFVGVQVDNLIASLRATGPGTLHVLDAPPIIPIVETATLASKVDVVVLVVRAGVTPRPAVEEAIARLGDEAKLCIVLNAVSRPAIGRNYDYAYATYGPNAQD